MKGLFSRERVRAAVGLIAAYAIALQTLFAAFAPLPANATGNVFGQVPVICFGSGVAPSGDGEGPASPRAAGFHCVLCGSVLAGAAIAPDAAFAPVQRAQKPVPYALSLQETLTAPVPARDGPARAPPPSL